MGFDEYANCTNMSLSSQYLASVVRRCIDSAVRLSGNQRIVLFKCFNRCIRVALMTWLPVLFEWLNSFTSAWSITKFILVTRTLSPTSGSNPSTVGKFDRITILCWFICSPQLLFRRIPLLPTIAHVLCILMVEVWFLEWWLLRISFSRVKYMESGDVEEE